MTVVLRVDSIATELGSASFVHAFFSTLSGRLEPHGWGSRFPVLLHELYQGGLARQHAEAALEELRRARTELTRFSPADVIWDIENPEARPPWGSDIAPDITHLGHYFVTSTGHDLFDTLLEVLEFFRDQGSECELTRL